MDSTGLFEACLALRVGGVARGELYGVSFNIARYGVGWWCYWTSPRLEVEYRKDGTIGIHLPVEDMLWAACCGDFDKFWNRRVRVMTSPGWIN